MNCFKKQALIIKVILPPEDKKEVAAAADASNISQIPADNIKKGVRDTFKKKRVAGREFPAKV